MLFNSPILTSSTLLFALSTLISPTQATFSQGSVNLTRDHLIHYQGYTSTESFCKAFRQGCVNFNEVIGRHHQLDCVFDQPGPNVRAFCGGVKKDLFGQWTPGETIEGFTTTMIHLVKGASIVSGPLAKGSSPPPSTPSATKTSKGSTHKTTSTTIASHPKTTKPTKPHPHLPHLPHLPHPHFPHLPHPHFPHFPHKPIHKPIHKPFPWGWPWNWGKKVNGKDHGHSKIVAVDHEKRDEEVEVEKRNIVTTEESGFKGSKRLGRHGRNSKRALVV